MYRIKGVTLLIKGFIYLNSYFTLTVVDLWFTHSGFRHQIHQTG